MGEGKRKEGKGAGLFFPSVFDVGDANLNSHHSMADVANLAQDLKEQKRIECFQIFIHRDEGKSREDLNYYAHMVFDWRDKKEYRENKAIEQNRYVADSNDCGQLTQHGKG